MDTLKKGDIISCGKVREVILARIEDLVATRRLFNNGSVGQVSAFIEIDDLTTYGFTKES